MLSFFRLSRRFASLNYGHVALYGGSDEMHFRSKLDEVELILAEAFEQQDVDGIETYIQTQGGKWQSIVSSFMDEGLNDEPGDFIWGKPRVCPSATCSYKNSTHLMILMRVLPGWAKHSPPSQTDTNRQCRQTFALAVAQLPQTRFLGRNTSGAFSDPLVRHVPKD
jgi:hypothetical protein